LWSRRRPGWCSTRGVGSLCNLTEDRRAEGVREEEEEEEEKKEEQLCIRQI